jgi:DNA recombination protein RmuC
MIDILTIGIFGFSLIGIALFFFFKIKKDINLLRSIFVSSTGENYINTMQSAVKNITEWQKNTDEKLEGIRKNHEEMLKNQVQWVRLLSGSQTKGIAGQNILKEILYPLIKAGKIVCNIKVGSGFVEYGYKLKDGKYIPIDSKSGLDELFNQLEKTEEIKKREEIVSEIKVRMKSRVKEAEKYLYSNNTNGKIIVTVPKGILNIFPEIISQVDPNMIVCSYEEALYWLHILETEHEIRNENRNIDELMKLNKEKEGLFKGILNKISTLYKGIEMIKNATESIEQLAIKGEGKTLLDETIEGD